MKKIIIHAGPEKTGTSAIQAWCNNNRSILSDNGVYYPPHTTDDSNSSAGNIASLLSVTNAGKWYVDELKAPRLLNSPEAANCHTILLSSEYFYQHIAELSQTFSEVEFIVYLRSPMETALSSYNSTIKTEGRTDAFVVNINGFTTIRHLAELMRHDKDLKLSIRPYSNALFVDGNIINDFLATLKITHRAVDNIIVNTSYTFEALEFKRFANFFTSYRISDRLATALQECKIGQHRYSFIYPNTFEKIRENILRDLKDFINEFSLPYLQSYYNWLDTKPIVGPYIEQKASTAQLRQIADYLKENHLYIYESLEKSIRDNTQICLPNNEFYHLFDCKFTPIFSDEELQNMSDFANKIIKFENAGSSDVFRELAFLLYERSEVKTAHEFMQLANYLRPNGSFIAKHLKDYQQSLPDREYKLSIYPNEYKINWATKEYRFSSTESKLSALFHFCTETKERCKEYIARIRSFFYKLMAKN